MTLIEFLGLMRAVVAAAARVQDALLVAESPQEVDLHLNRLEGACEALATAKCGEVSTSDVVEASRVLHEARRLIQSLREKAAEECA